MKLYATKAEIYDRMIQSAGKHYKEESGLIANILQKSFKGRNPPVLDLGCGTGTHAAELIRQGFNVICGDINKEMLAIAKKKTGAECLEMDMRRFLLRKKVGAIICLYNTLFYNQNAEELMSTFSSCRINLEPGGILILQVTDPSLFRGDKNTSFTWALNNREIVVQSTFIRLPRMLHHFSFINLDTKKEESDWHEMRIFPLRAIKDSLIKCGFCCIKITKDKNTLYITGRRK
ncbi:MAG: class I SAM-dependent methyltransferase [Nanoarchaeota archaeon]|nr:class I SAM-dependent methyltransferase [Nanoarchaeota archaeon]